MSQGLVQLVAGLPAAVAAPVVVRVLRENRALWNVTASYLLMLGWLLNPLHAVAAFTNGISISRDPVTFETQTIYDDRTHLIFRAGLLFLIVASAVLVIRRVTRARPAVLAPAGLVALLLCGLVSLSNAGSGLPVVNNGTRVMLAVFVAATFAQGGAGARLGAATFGITLALASSALVVVQYSAAVRDCGQQKCGPLGVLVNGATANENALGLALALALPYVYLSFVGWARWILTSYVTLMVFLTGSRTSLVCALVTVTVILLVRPGGADVMVAGVRRLIAALVPTTALVVAAILPFVVTRGSQFTNRGYLWQLARARLSGAGWFGRGSLYWPTLRAQGAIEAGAIYSPHNQWMDILLSGGLWGAAALLVLLLLIVRSAGRPGFILVALVLVPVAVMSTTERPWGFGQPDWLVWSIVAAILAADPIAKAVGNPRAPTPRGVAHPPGLASSRPPNAGAGGAQPVG